MRYLLETRYIWRIGREEPWDWLQSANWWAISQQANHSYCKLTMTNPTRRMALPYCSNFWVQPLLFHVWYRSGMNPRSIQVADHLYWKLACCKRRYMGLAIDLDNPCDTNVNNPCWYVYPRIYHDLPSFGSSFPIMNSHSIHELANVVCRVSSFLKPNWQITVS